MNEHKDETGKAQKSFIQKLGRWVLYLLLMLLLILVLVTHQKRKDVEKRNAAYRAFVEQCNAKWQGQPRVPIIGGGYLDATRLRWNARSNVFNKKECGAETFNDVFFWTGTEIIPDFVWMKRYRESKMLIERPKEWVVMSALYILGYPRKVNDDGTYPAWQNLTGRREPSGEVVKLNNAKMEVWMSGEGTYKKKKSPTDSMHRMGFIFSDWPKDEGPPRWVTCDLKRDVMVMTREDIEQLDLLQQRLFCQMDFKDFRFRGGKARVNITVDSLAQIYPAVRALHKYFSASVSEPVGWGDDRNPNKNVSHITRN